MVDGGWIVQLIASDHPERVSRLILIDSVGLNIKPAWDTELFTPPRPSSWTSSMPCSCRIAGDPGIHGARHFAQFPAATPGSSSARSPR